MIEKSGVHRQLSIISSPRTPPLLDWTFNDVLREQSKSRSQHNAVVCPHQSRRLTYGDLQHRSWRVAAGLHELGVRKGDRVAVLLGNRIEYIEIFLACSKLGAYATLINYAASSFELQEALRSTSPKVLLATLTTARYSYISILRRLAAQSTTVPALKQIVILEDISKKDADADKSGLFLSYEDLIQKGLKSAGDIAELEEEVKSEDILNLQFTSGSTGLPKAAALTHHGMVNSARYIGLQMRLRSTDSIVIPVPLFHAFGLIIGFGIMAGSAMPEELLNRVMTAFPIPELYTNWGMTELSSIATMTTASDSIEKKMKTAGKLLPHFTGKIVDPNTGRTLPWGCRGEIVICGFGVMHSYYGNEDQTRKSIRTHTEDLLPGQLGPDEQGSLRRWMHTGDEGYLDQDGYLVITGRIKDLIIRGGENISPLEIEARLYEHPAIRQAAVFGVPSDRYGEEVAAILELEDKYNGGESPPSDAELKAWLRKTLSRYKTPVYFWWLGDKKLGVPAEWPKTANGKLKKTDIKALGEKLLKSSLVDLVPSL